MRSASLLVLICSELLLAGADAEDPKPLTPVEAIKKMNQKVLVQMQVRATKNRLVKWGGIYLD